MFDLDTAYSNETNTCHYRRVPSPNRWHQPAPFSATDHVVPRWPPRPPPPVVGGKSSPLDGADSSFHFKKLFSFLRAVVGFNLGCVSSADSAESDSRLRCPCDARRWLHMALTIVMLSTACCVSTAQGTWSTAQLSVGRVYLAATSVGNVAIFGGGHDGDCIFWLFVTNVAGLLFGLISVGDAVMFACLRHAACFLLCLRRRRLLSHRVHCRWWRFQCCGLVQHSIGHMVDCAAQCGARVSCCDICWERVHLRRGLHR
jgi:hypothetical protein